MVIGNYAEDWLTIIEVEEKTLTGYRTGVKYMKKFFGPKDIRTIRYGDIVKFKKWLPAGPKTKCNHVSTLRTLMGFACKNKDIQSIPPFPKLSHDLPEIEYLKFEQQEKVLNKIPERDRPIFYFMQEYGVRPGEARAFKKDCLIKGEVVIKRTFSENTLKERTKTKLIRRYEITPYIEGVLDNMEQNLSPFFFVRKDGKPYTSKNLNEIWHKACEEAKIKIKMYNGFRHSLGCQLLDQGEDMDLVRQQLGHTKIEMTQRYAKRSISKLTDALNKRRDNVVPIKKAG